MCPPWPGPRASHRLRGESPLAPPLLWQRGPQRSKDTLALPAKLATGTGELQRKVAELLLHILHATRQEPGYADIREKGFLRHATVSTASLRSLSTRPAHNLAGWLPSRKRSIVSQTGGVLLHLVLRGNKIERTLFALFAERKDAGLRIGSLAI